MTTVKRTLPYPVWLEQAAKFLSVGILNTALDVGLYSMLIRWLGVPSANPSTLLRAGLRAGFAA